MDLGLKGKKAIVTGASRGIGRATALLLAQEGCDIAICARQEEQVSETVAALSAMGAGVFGQAVDVGGDGDRYKEWIGRASEQLGGLDIFIPTVSAMGGRQDEDGWWANFQVDILGAVRGVEAARPALEQSAGGSIVFVSTTAALEEFGGPQSYNSMKAALINYASNLSQHLAPHGIRVNTVSPGPIFVPGGIWNWIKDNMPDRYDATVANIPMGHMGTAENVAHAVVFLASPLSAFTTGTNLVVDGGITRRVQY